MHDSPVYLPYTFCFTLQMYVALNLNTRKKHLITQYYDSHQGWRKYRRVCLSTNAQFAC